MADKTRLTTVLFFLFMGAVLVNVGILPQESDAFVRVFVELGTKIIFDMSIFMEIIPQAIILTSGLLFSQIASASITARYTGGFESIMIEIGMPGRAELAFVVMDIAYVQNNIITTEVFYTLMVTAFALNMAVPLGIGFWKPYFMGEKSNMEANPKGE